MTSDEAKKYCIDIIGMCDSDFTKATNDDSDFDDEINIDDWIHVFVTPTECGDECESITAIQMAKDHKFWSNPENVKAHEDHLFQTYVSPKL